MRVLVLAHRLELGGTQTNAIELAAEVRDRHGHEVTLVAAPGPASALAEARGLSVVPAPDPRRHPSVAVMRALHAAVRASRPELLHVWDWPQCFDAYFGEHLLGGRPVLCTVMGMVVPRFLPRHLHLTFGTRALVEEARERRPGPVDLLEPPVDVRANAPEAVDDTGFRRRFAIDGTRLTISVVTRLTDWLKLESLLRTIRAVDALAVDLPVRLLVAGEGPARDRVERLADEVNERHGAPVVVLTGGLVDPRPAYQVADVVVGMGGSALRAMSFAKPLVVLGERGFSRPLTAASASWFLQHGWYGLGDGDLSPSPLERQLRELLGDSARRAANGALARRVVEAHYGLEPAAAVLDDLYRRVAAEPVHRPRALGEGLRTAALLAGRRLPESLLDRLRPSRPVPSSPPPGLSASLEAPTGNDPDPVIAPLADHSTHEELQ